MMAAMQEFAEKGNQIFITLVRGKEYPPTTVDVRCGYNQTIGELRQKLEAASGCPVDKQLLFYKHREVRPEMDAKTLLELNLHTGFALSGYDLRDPPVFFPPVARTPTESRTTRSARDTPEALHSHPQRRMGQKSLT